MIAKVFRGWKVMSCAARATKGEQRYLQGGVVIAPWGDGQTYFPEVGRADISRQNSEFHAICLALFALFANTFFPPYQRPPLATCHPTILAFIHTFFMPETPW